MKEQRQGRWSTVKIYLDGYIAASFWLHLLCLYLTGAFIKNRGYKIGKRRLMCAALCCTGTDVAGVIFLSLCDVSEHRSFLWLLSVAGMVLGAWISFGKRTILRNTLLLLAVTALLAGLFQAIPVRNVGVFCMAGTVLIPFLIEGGRALFRIKQTGASIYDVTLYQQDREKHFSALMDTGNRLRLYGSRIPVVLVDECCLKEWMKEAEQNTPQKLVFIPYKGVGGKGLLYGVRLYCCLRKEDGGVCYGEVAAVTAEHRLFQGCGYQMILQPEVLTMDCVKDTQEGEKNVI